MILTVTLNVAIDKAYRVEKLTPGEVMRVLECSYTAGGKGLNVTKVAKIAGAQVLATGFSGGHAGAFVEEQLAEKKIASDFFHVKGETRSCVNILEEGSRRQTEFLEPGFTVTREETDAFFHKFSGLLEKADVVTLSGSAPRGCGEDIYRVLVTMAKEKGKRVILDSSGKLLERGIEALPTLIKPNSDEIGALTGHSIADRSALIENAARLHKRGIPYVVVSLGKEGSLMVCEDGIFHGITPDIPVVNTVGCGDSMVAAFAVGFERGYGSAELLRFATAVSTANALTMETGFYRPEDFERVFRQCEVKRLPEG